jgi:hypothetical protein
LQNVLNERLARCGRTFWTFGPLCGNLVIHHGSSRAFNSITAGQAVPRRGLPLYTFSRPWHSRTHSSAEVSMPTGQCHGTGFPVAWALAVSMTMTWLLLIFVGVLSPHFSSLCSTLPHVPCWRQWRRSNPTLSNAPNGAMEGASASLKGSVSRGWGLGTLDTNGQCTRPTTRFTVH